MTDCGDLWELVQGTKVMAQDKQHRMYVTSLREDRLIGRIRCWIQVPTQCMLADALTKSMIAPQFVQLLTTGTVQFWNHQEHRIRIGTMQQYFKEYTEQELNSALETEKRISFVEMD